MKREEMLNLPPREWVEHLLDNEIFSLDMWVRVFLRNLSDSEIADILDREHLNEESLIHGW
tara:strand:- start:72 stop:254 length:183 start_codon:yes stop_codon:yes gene_type:complete